MTSKPSLARLREPIRDPNKAADQRLVEWPQEFAAPAYKLELHEGWLYIGGDHARRAVPLSAVLFVDVAPEPVATKAPAPTHPTTGKRGGK